MMQGPPVFPLIDQVTMFKARGALMDYKGKFIACFSKAEATLWSYQSDLTQRIIISDFCEAMSSLLADLNDQFVLHKFD